MNWIIINIDSEQTRRHQETSESRYQQISAGVSPNNIVKFRASSSQKSWSYQMFNSVWYVIYWLPTDYLWLPLQIIVKILVNPGQGCYREKLIIPVVSSLELHRDDNIDLKEITLPTPAIAACPVV
jgi:hypothetical protein